MADPILGEVTIFAGNFNPAYWAYCQGQTLQIVQYSALYSLLGTIYGGDGRTTFGLPDLRDRCVVGYGTADVNTGRSARNFGEYGGTETVTLTSAQMPAHIHTATNVVSGAITVTSTLKCLDGTAASGTPESNVFAQQTTTDNANKVYKSATADTSMHASSISSTATHNLAVATTVGVTGSSAAHNNMQPWLCLGYIIALNGIYPTRE
jgi:microcystin-dependent protein